MATRRIVPVVKRKTKVFWTTREADTVAHAAASLMLKNTSMSPLKAINDAQDAILPADRHRTVKTTSAVKPVVDEIYRYLKKMQEPDEPAKPEEIPEDRPVIEETLEHKVGHAVMVLMESFADILSKKMADNLMSHMGEILAMIPHNTATPIQQIMREKLAPRTNLPTMLVVGLKGHQKTEVLDEFRDKVNLSFWTVDQSSHQLKSMCKDTGKVIVLTKFISHSHEQAVRAIAHDRMVRINGGISILKTTISSLITH